MIVLPVAKDSNIKIMFHPTVLFTLFPHSLSNDRSAFVQKVDQK